MKGVNLLTEPNQYALTENNFTCGSSGTVSSFF